MRFYDLAGLEPQAILVSHARMCTHCLEMDSYQKRGYRSYQTILNMIYYLSREYYDLMDNRSSYVNKLQGELWMVYPQYL